MVELTQLLLWLTILIGGSVVLSTILKRFNIPLVVSFIIIGMVSGPYGFNVVTDVEMIDLFAGLGVVILVFVIGLEFNIERIKDVSSTIIITTLIAVSISFLLVFIIAYMLVEGIIESFYISSIIVMSSTAIILKLLQELGISHTKEASTLVGILIIEDIVTILILAILIDLTKSIETNISNIIIILAQSVTFFIVTLIIGLKIVPKIINYIDKVGIEEAPTLTALALGFGLALLATILGLSTAIGAFLIGMMLSTVHKSSSIRERLLPLRDFLAAIFFISIGMLIDVREVPQYILFSLPLLIIAITSKFIGVYIGAIITGHNRLSASTISTLMIPRGEFSFIIAKQGTELGIKTALMPLAMIIVLVTTIIMPLMLRIMPTVIDARTIFPSKFFAGLEFIGSLIRGLILKGYNTTSKRILNKILANILIMIIILTALVVMEDFIVTVYNTFNTLQIVKYEYFKLILTSILLIYPFINIFMDISIFAQSLSQSFRLVDVKAPENIRYLYRIMRNVASALAILLISSFIVPSIAVISGVKIVLPISSIISLVLFVYFFIDTFFIIHKKLEKEIISSLLGEKES
ncbi:MAG: cation:proton antiporter [Candidatus Nitrosocaldaceae archaeon]